VLVIDDVGLVPLDKAAGNAFYQVVNRRYENGSATIVTTNLAPKEVAEGYGGRLMSLLSEVCEPLEFRGLDRRNEVQVRRQRERDLGLVRPLVLR